MVAMHKVYTDDPEAHKKDNMPRTQWQHTEYGPGLRCLLSGSQLSHHCTETRRCKQTGVYSVSLYMLMMTREMTSLGLLTTAKGTSWLESTQSCGFTCQMINSLSPFTSVLGDAQITCPVTLVPGHGLQRSCRGRTWPTHWLISSTETTNTPEMARGSSLWLSVSTLTRLWLQYRNACHTQLVIKIAMVETLLGSGGQRSSEIKTLFPGAQLFPWYYCQRKAEAKRTHGRGSSDALP